MEKSGFIQYNLCQNCILFFENCIKKYTEKTGLLSKKLYKSDFFMICFRILHNFLILG